VPPWTIVAGMPARPLKVVEDSDRRELLRHFGLTEDQDIATL
jgi:acetyltransferase-like isoleucine patch superfamily enzyme